MKIKQSWWVRMVVMAIVAISAVALPLALVAQSDARESLEHGKPDPLPDASLWDVDTTTAQQSISAVAAYSNLTDLIPAFDYLNWFTAEIGYTFGSGFFWFGAYAIEPDGDDLYLGFGRSSPAASDGALLAQYDTTSGTLTRLGAATPLNEQGFIDMHLANGNVYVPGTDPCCGDLLSDSGASGSYTHQWDWGNAYVYDIGGGTMTKHRNQPDTLHTWGHWVDLSTNTLFAAASGFHCCNPPPDQIDEDWTGWVFASANDGDDWTLLADSDGSRVAGKVGMGDSVGTYRTYDIIGFNSTLYIEWADIIDNPDGTQSVECGLASSSDDGETWSRMAGVAVRCARRLAVIDGYLVAAAPDADGLVLVDNTDTAQTLIFPDFKLGSWAFSYITEDTTRGHVYVAANDGALMRTSNLIGNSWETVAATDYELSEIAYWPNEDMLVVADNGESGRLWEVGLPASSLSPPAAPDAMAITSGMVDWDPVAGATHYNVYASTYPYLNGNQYYATGSTVATQINMTAFGNSAVNGFFIIRAVGPDGVSPTSQRVGEFDFDIVPGN